MVFTARHMRCTGGGPGSGLGSGLGSGWDSSGEAIWQGELTALACADVYLLDLAVERARGAASMSGREGWVGQP